MKELRITLIGDGSSDKTLLLVVNWLLNDLFPTLCVKTDFADFRRLPNPPSKAKPNEQVERAMHYYPFDLLIYHRDAETNDILSVEIRKKEIFEQLNDIQKQVVVCVVPVRMMETWFLINKEAIKRAAGNRNFRGEVELPDINKLEKEANPKKRLHEVLKITSGLKGRKLEKFNVHQSVHLVAEYITDFSPLRQLEAFQIFENDLKIKISEIANMNKL